MFEDISVGVDIEEISRFEGKTADRDFAFLNKIFTSKELEYSFSDNNSSKHLCARYCAKEAVVKALQALNIKGIYYRDIEISNNIDGVPIASVKNHSDLQIKVSLSHCKNYATAMAIVKKPNKVSC